MLHCGPTEEKKQSRGAKGKIARFPESEAPAVLGGLVVTVLSSSSVYSRQAHEHGRQEEGWCLMHTIFSRNTTVRHLSVFFSHHPWTETHYLGGCKAVYFISTSFTSFVFWLFGKWSKWREATRRERTTRAGMFGKYLPQKKFIQHPVRRWKSSRKAGGAEFSELWGAVEM